MGNKKNRPILNNGNKRLILEELATKRNSFYSQADIHVGANQNAKELIIEAIINELEKLKNAK